MGTISHFSFFSLLGKIRYHPDGFFFAISVTDNTSRCYCWCTGRCFLFNCQQLSTCHQQRGNYASKGKTNVPTSYKVVELPFPPPDVRTRHVVEFVQDRLIVCGGGESWQGPFHSDCYQVLILFTQTFLQFSVPAEPKLHWMDCF